MSAREKRQKLQIAKKIVERKNRATRSSIKIFNSCKKQLLCISTQLAKAIMERNKRRQYNLRNATLYIFKRYAHRPYVQRRMHVKRHKLNKTQIRKRTSNLVSKKHNHLVIVTPYIRVWLAIAKKKESNKKKNEYREYKQVYIKISKIIIVKNRAYLLLTTFADPS